MPGQGIFFWCCFVLIDEVTSAAEAILWFSFSVCLSQTSTSQDSRLLDLKCSYVSVSKHPSLVNPEGALSSQWVSSSSLDLGLVPDVGLWCIVAVTSSLPCGPHCSTFGCHLSQVPRRSAECKAGHFLQGTLGYAISFIELMFGF